MVVRGCWLHELKRFCVWTENAGFGTDLMDIEGLMGRLTVL